MKFWKNIEVSKLFGVNPTTVTNWIEAAKLGKNNLQLIKYRGRDYILSNQHNTVTIGNLTEKGRKHKSKDLLKIVKPKDEFYHYFSVDQISEIVSYIENYREIPHKYVYLKDGAIHWQMYAERSFREGLANTVTNTFEMLETSMKYFINQIKPNQKINIVDIGVGDASPVKGFLEQMIKLGRLNKYIAVDISTEMIEIARKNLISWFGEDFPFQGEVRDINKDSIQDLLFYSASSNDLSQNSKNIVLFLGSTIENQKDFLKTLINIQSSLGREDLVAMGLTLDSPNAKGYFDFSSDGENEHYQKIIKTVENWPEFPILQMLNIDIENFDLELVYDERDKARVARLVLMQDLEIQFKSDSFHRNIFLKKGEKITTWRHSHHSIPEIVEILNTVGFYIKHITTSSDEAQIILTCRQR